MTAVRSSFLSPFPLPSLVRRWFNSKLVVKKSWNLVLKEQTPLCRSNPQIFGTIEGRFAYYNGQTQRHASFTFFTWQFLGQWPFLCPCPCPCLYLAEAMEMWGFCSKSDETSNSGHTLPSQKQELDIIELYYMYIYIYIHIHVWIICTYNSSCHVSLRCPFPSRASPRPCGPYHGVCHDLVTILK